MEICTAEESPFPHSHGLTLELYSTNMVIQEHGYICQGRCRRGYKWHGGGVGKCLMVEGKRAKTLPDAWKHCSDTGGRLVNVADCYALNVLRESVIKKEVPAGTRWVPLLPML